MKNKIDFKKTAQEIYDGKKVNWYIADEVGQLAPIKNRILRGDDVKAIAWALKTK